LFDEGWFAMTAICALARLRQNVIFAFRALGGGRNTLAEPLASSAADFCSSPTEGVVEAPCCSAGEIDSPFSEPEEGVVGAPEAGPMGDVTEGMWLWTTSVEPDEPPQPASTRAATMAGASGRTAARA
jgi:hypothetical protein